MPGPATADQVLDLTILHQIGLQRYSVTVLKRMLSTLRVMRVDIERQIRERGGGDEVRSLSSQRLAGLLQQVDLTMAEAHRALRGEFEAGITPVVEAEATFATLLARTSVGTDVNLATVSAEQLRSAVMSNPMQGKSLREWTQQLETGDRTRIRQQITLGYLEGESVPQIVKRVQAVSDVTARGAETLARTSMTHINARAVAQNAQNNPELFKRYQWVSVLDNRTTPVCRARAGKVFTHGSNPLPPAHPGCRSTIYNLVRGVQPPDDIGFDAWLKRQSAEDQKDILGPVRYGLWKAGMPLEKFVDGGRSLTIEQLKQRDAAMFAKAGL